MRIVLRDHDEVNSLSHNPQGGPSTHDLPIPPRRILIAEDNPLLCEQLKEVLAAEEGVTVDTTGDGREALEMITRAERRYSLFLTDLKMPGLDGIQLVEELQRRSAQVTVIVFTGHGSIQDAVQAMRLGACDFLTKPIDPEYLRLVVRRALRERSLQDEIMLLREQMQQRYSFQNILSKNPQLHAIFELINNVAQTTTTVLVEGETGTGKELIARAIHQASARLRPGPFVAINCAALPESLLESELFGHERGAFTGASALRRGKFELAEGGTIFLDEIGDMDIGLQAKILRVLQERQFERVGGERSLPADVRVIAATNQNLEAAVAQKSFREDLYYRLNVVAIMLPPLRERIEDIPLLVNHFLHRFAEEQKAEPKSLPPETLELMLAYHWPGNVRELENAVKRACVLAPTSLVLPEHLPAVLLQAEAASGSGGRSSFERLLSQGITGELSRLQQEQDGQLYAYFLAALERPLLLRVLERTGGNQLRAAELLGINRNTLRKKLRELGVAPGRGDDDAAKG